MLARNIRGLEIPQEIFQGDQQDSTGCAGDRGIDGSAELVGQLWDRIV